MRDIYNSEPETPRHPSNQTQGTLYDGPFIHLLPRIPAIFRRHGGAFNILLSLGLISISAILIFLALTTLFIILPSEAIVSLGKLSGDIPMPENLDEDGPLTWREKYRMAERQRKQRLMDMRDREEAQGDLIDYNMGLKAARMRRMQKSMRKQREKDKEIARRWKEWKEKEKTGNRGKEA
ncbi:hypothetical protein ABW19_dt0209357 [Dactylella cylindrospora]|nr:hypothetical protein ABW19_dt0209357 [Dactylella cylindrospora]